MYVLEFDDNFHVNNQRLTDKNEIFFKINLKKLFKSFFSKKVEDTLSKKKKQVQNSRKHQTKSYIFCFLIDSSVKLTRRSN